ncbi:NAD(+)/NADH kinase [Clostridium sp. DL1XJH146]
MKNIAININREKVKDKSVVQNIISLFKENLDSPSIEIFYDSIGIENLNEKTELLVVLGGDGTILRVQKKIGTKNIPIIGINFGNLGFLASMEIDDIEKGIVDICKGNYYIQERMLLECTLQKNKTKKIFYALNEIVISRDLISCVFKYGLKINDKLFTTYFADGIIVSTATGSTAYSLSAGGPIIDPSLSLVCITPICPHSMQSRSIIVNENNKIEIDFSSNTNDSILSIDGHICSRLDKYGKISIEKSQYKCKIVTLNGYNYYRILKKKLF